MSTRQQQKSWGPAVTKADFSRLETLVEGVAENQREVGKQLGTIVEIVTSQDRRITVAEQQIVAGESSRGSIRTRDLLTLASLCVFAIGSCCTLLWFVIDLRVTPLENQQERTRDHVSELRVDQAYERGVLDGRRAP